MRKALVVAGTCALALGTAAALHLGRAEEPRHVPAPPAGMVFVPGGEVEIGAKDGRPDERPVVRVRVRPFFMDTAPVTVAEFRAFVDSTGYVTTAERLGNAGVLDSRTGHWVLVPGATWHHPLGPSGPKAPDDHQVTQVSWHDAADYARWTGKRLPTEFEWEHAARVGAGDGRRYPWGSDSLRGADGRPRANIWQASAHERGDGYLLTSPVGAFGANRLGLVDLAGNVWEWTDSWYRSYAALDDPFTPDESSERVQRGGSFLCHEDFCHGYRVSARSHSTAETSLFHVGFRLVRDIHPAE